MSKFHILALDGGGIKGIFSAAILAHIEEDLNISIIDHFDLIAGTSTGGIIALGLGVGMKPREILKFYIDQGPCIFYGMSAISVRKYWRSKFSSEPLKEALMKCFQKKLLGDSKKRLVIPSYSLSDDDVYLFKTPHHERLKRDFKIPIWKVALATAAAPTYFPAFNDLDNIRFIDGGVWANNPTLVGISEAVSMLGQPLNEITVLSLATTSDVKTRSANLDNGGLFQWREAAVDVILRGQSIGTHTQAQHLLGKDRVIRINPKVPEGLFELDKLTEKELMGKAAHESRHFIPVFEQTFLGHRSAEFKPLYHLKVEDPINGNRNINSI